ncbi:hypothetical protein [Erythrobacter neustonensis]|nr:hypothetical protein [Erythrobacter neustonensis]
MKRDAVVHEYSKRLAKLADELAQLGLLVPAAHAQAAADSLSESAQ